MQSRRKEASCPNCLENIAGASILNIDLLQVGDLNPISFLIRGNWSRTACTIFAGS